MTKHLKLRYFASVREALGPGETGTFAVDTLGQLRDALIALGGPHADVLSRTRSLRCAVNQTMAMDDVVLREGDEIAFFPPVTGG